MTRKFRSACQRRDLTCEDAYRLYLISRNAPPIVHHSTGMQWKRLRVLVRRVHAVFASIRFADMADRMRRRQAERMRRHRAV